MILPTLEGARTLTHSRMRAFKTCRRKHYYSYILGVRREQSEALRIGSMVHEALDMLKKGFAPADVKDAIDTNYATLIDAANSDEFAIAMTTERAKVTCMVDGWIWRWSETPIEYVASEIAFEIPLRNPTPGGRVSRVYRLAGKADGIATLEDGRLALVEHKTSGESLAADGSYWQRLRIDEQISTYMIAARELGYAVVAVLYDVLRKPSIRLKQSETVAEYAERFMADIYERPDFYFARREIVRLESDLDDMRRELWQIAHEVRLAERNGTHYRNPGACVSPYPCEYLDCCANGTDMIADTPAGMVRVRNLNPELE